MRLATLPSINVSRKVLVWFGLVLVQSNWKTLFGRKASEGGRKKETTGLIDNYVTANLVGLG